MIVGIIVSALAFGIFAFAGILIAKTYFNGAPIADGPPVAEPPVIALLIAAAVAGGICAYRGMPPSALGIVAASCALMAAIWYTDVTRGIVPDSLTLVPLIALIIAGFLTGRWYVAVVAAVPAAPFAFMAWRTKGIGMGWGDVKLAALGGALLGMKDAMLAFAVVSIVAIVIAKIQRREKQPLAFAPYLATAIIIPLVLRTGS
ncbi:MAG: prepilin peptidase [Candidatus Velthaea sp.]|jgi:leader peptidase (prepilin peptidase)/N-methyltransferase